MISDADQLMQSFVFILLAFAILATPIVAVISESVFLLITVKRSEKITSKNKSVFLLVDMITIFLAVVLQIVYLSFCDVMFNADWQTQLYNSQKHQPVYTGSLPTFITIAVLGVVGFCVLNHINVNKTPPLIPVIAMSLLYMGDLLSVVFSIHVFDFSRMGMFELYLLLPPIVFILMSLRVILGVVRDYAPSPDRMSKVENSAPLSSFFKMLENSKRWPVIGLVMTIPMLGILICILMIFGQAPDAVIKAFTETADFRLSQKIPPQQLYYDEHYLCTVAAGGDRKIVKPLRMGIRHGHPVVVNRQLCVANAFEQVLEERTPGFHRAVRSFYDTYGFPVARLIRTKKTADLVYFMMKPLEWLFLIVLYMSDVNPEDRIAMQYTGDPGSF
ncbi:MAG: hypothetical protein K6E49_05040 [Lachnospiraceae bacterium]|nr:hypothetical protein [Lachnospiraceae bacterium]